MATKSRRSSQDGRRVSAEPHEINYTGAKIAAETGTSRRRGKRAVKRAKKQTGTVSRGPVERRAKRLASRSKSGASRKARSQRAARRRPSTAHGRVSRSHHLSHTTTDHDEIRRWAEERGAHPAAVKRTSNGRHAGIIRLDFPGYSGANTLERITWGEFFDEFEDAKLALVYQEHTAQGERSNFNKLVRRRRR